MPYLNLSIDKRLTILDFLNDDIDMIILNLDPCKAHGHDKIWKKCVSSFISVNLSVSLLIIVNKC